MTKFSLVINANSGEELKANVLEAASIFGGNATGAVAPKEVSKSAEEKPKRGRKPKDENPFEEEAAAAPTTAAPEKNDNPFEEDEAPAPAPKKALTFDDVKAALQKVADQKGMEKAKEVVAALKVTKVSQIQPEQFAEAVAICEKALK